MQKWRSYKERNSGSSKEIGRGGPARAVSRATWAADPLPSGSEKLEWMHRAEGKEKDRMDGWERTYINTHIYVCIGKKRKGKGGKSVAKCCGMRGRRMTDGKNTANRKLAPGDSHKGSVVVEVQEQMHRILRAHILSEETIRAIHPFHGIHLPMHIYRGKILL